MDDLPPFDEWWHDILLKAGHMHPKALDGRTHYTRTVQGRVKPACGSPKGTRLHTDWRLVNCPDCRRTTTQSITMAASNGLYPVGYRYRVRDQLHEVTGYQQIAYGQIAHEVTCNGVKCMQAYEFIRQYGKAEAR
jgi:hypothetical protein